MKRYKDILTTPYNFDKFFPKVFYTSVHTNIFRLHLPGHYPPVCCLLYTSDAADECVNV